MMTLGGKGVISTAANVVPKEMAELANLCLKKHYDQAAQLQLKLLPLIRVLFIETNPIPLKTALASMGKCDLELRLPLVTMAEGNTAKLREAMKNFSLI